ncbi:MAG: site-specific tyrosine recombinase XerD [Bacteroidales bacterium]|nr:site-specific tyrosine recombinase XerD [Bacteroidales bacterium]
MNWDNTISDFRSYLRLERSMSENTINSYLSDLKKLKLFLSERGGSDVPDSDAITSEDLSQFVESQQSLGISKRSQARMVSAMRTFYKFLELEGVVKKNPTDRIGTPKISRYIPVVLSVDEVDRIISSVDLSDPLGHRNKAILETLYSCGLRVSELVELKISDLFMDESFIRVVGKGNKQRLVPIGELAKDAIVHYLKQSRRAFSQEDILFLNRRGKKLSRVMVFNIVKVHAEKAGVVKNISPHTFRHSFASHMVENGADLRVVQQMLGHESILTTEIYTHIDTQKWEEEILCHHPRG